MKRLTKWMLLAAMAGPGTMYISCSSMLVQEVRDAVFSAVGTVVEQTTLTALGQGG